MTVILALILSQSQSIPKSTKEVLPLHLTDHGTIDEEKDPDLEKGIVDKDRDQETGKGKDPGLRSDLDKGQDQKSDGGKGRGPGRVKEKIGVKEVDPKRVKGKTGVKGVAQGNAQDAMIDHRLERQGTNHLREKARLQKITEAMLNHRNSVTKIAKRSWLK